MPAHLGMARLRERDDLGQFPEIASGGEVPGSVRRGRNGRGTKPLPNRTGIVTVRSCLQAA